MFSKYQNVFDIFLRIQEPDSLEGSLIFLKKNGGGKKISIISEIKKIQLRFQQNDTKNIATFSTYFDHWRTHSFGPYGNSLGKLFHHI